MISLALNDVFTDGKSENSLAFDGHFFAIAWNPVRPFCK